MCIQVTLCVPRPPTTSLPSLFADLSILHVSHALLLEEVAERTWPLADPAAGPGQSQAPNSSPVPGMCIQPSLPTPDGAHSPWESEVLLRRTSGLSADWWAAPGNGGLLVASLVLGPCILLTFRTEDTRIQSWDTNVLLRPCRGYAGFILLRPLINFKDSPGQAHRSTRLAAA